MNSERRKWFTKQFKKSQLTTTKVVIDSLNNLGNEKRFAFRNFERTIKTVEAGRGKAETPVQVKTWATNER